MSVLKYRKSKLGFSAAISTATCGSACLGSRGSSSRELLATISVNASQVVRSVDTQLLGVNVAWYDSVLNTPQTQQMVQAAGLTMFRFPGGSSSDDFHFNCAPDLQRRGHRREHGELHQLGQWRGAGHDRLRLGQPAGSSGLSGLPECTRRQHDGDRRGPGVERFDE